MKNFDFKLYDSLDLSMGKKEPIEWVEMCERCHKEYVLCRSYMTRSFIRWYESGGFHDSILKVVSPLVKKNGQWTVKIILAITSEEDGEKWELCYKDVNCFSFEKKKTNIPSSQCEECLYDEFYQTDDKKRIVHEFFTSKSSFFLIEFSKLSLKKL